MSKKNFLNQRYNNKIKSYIGIAIILIFSIFAIKPFLSHGFFPTHDDTQVARVFEMHESLRDGMFPVRWVSDLGYGYGYPIFNFYAPLAYYTGAFFMFLGFNALDATKIMMALGVMASGVSMYFLSREFWGKTAGVISGLLYVYAPYHALNIYVRGAIAELWAYAFLPLAFLGIYKVYEGLKEYANLQQKLNIKDLKLKLKRAIWYWVCLTALSYAGIILSHNLTAMMVSPFLFGFAFFMYIKCRLLEKIYRPYFVIFGLLIGMILSAFYWLPVPLEMKFTDVLSVVGGGSDYRDHFACISQLWNSPWGFAGSAPGCLDGFSLKIGKLHILLGIISLFTLIPLSKEDKTKFYIVILFQIFLLISLFLTLKESSFIWNALPPMAFFQFPWRFLVLVSFLISLLGGSVIWIMENINTKSQLYNKLKYFIAFILILGIVIINSKIFVPKELIPGKSEDYTNEKELKWRVSKISDEYMPVGFFKPLRSSDVPKRRFESKDKNIKVLSTEEKTQHIMATFITPNEASVYVNLAYFPGWHVYVDKKQIWFKYSGQGLIIDIPKGKHTVDIKFIQTPIEKIGNAISLSGVIILLAGIISHRKIIYGKKSP